MAFDNFKPTIWEKKILETRKRYCVGVNLSDTSYEKDVVDFGKAIVLNWTKRPTIRTYTAGTDISPAETLDDVSTTLNIDQMKYFNFEVDDVDKLQSEPDLMAACMDESAASIAEDSDNYIYALYSNAAVTTAQTVTNTQVTSANILSLTSKAKTIIHKNDVPTTEEVYLEVSPEIYEKMWLAKIIREANGGDASIANGFVGTLFNGCKVYMTNGVKIVNGVHKCLMRTKKAIAFAGQMKKTEAYKDPKRFNEAVKGLSVYGAAIQRPKELVVLSLTPIEETAI